LTSKSTLAVLAIILVVISFAAGIGVDRYFLAPAPPPTKEAIVFAFWGSNYGELATQISNNFTREFGNPVLIEYHAGASGTVIPKIQAAWPQVKIDVTGVAPTAALLLAQAGYLAELTPSEVPVLNEIPDNLLLRYEGKVIGAPIYSISTVNVAWRTDIIKEPIDNWATLMKPEYRHKIAMPYWGMGSGQMLVQLAYMFGGDEKNMEPGWNAMKELAPQIGAMYTTEAEAISYLSTGDYPIVFAITADKVFTLHQQGVPIAWRGAITGVPKPYFVNNPDYVVVINGPRQAIAKNFVSFFLNAHNNEYFNWNLGLPPANKNARINPDLSGWVPSSDEVAKSALVLDYLYLSQHYDEWTTRWDSEIVPLIGK